MKLLGEFVKGQSVCFSGRFDGPTLPHWITILRILSAGAAKVVVPILDYHGRRFPASRVRQVFEEAAALSGFTQCVSAMVNTTHFAAITVEEYTQYGCTRYISGNDKVLNRIELLGLPCMYLEPAYNMHASEYGTRSDENPSIKITA